MLRFSRKLFSYTVVVLSAFVVTSLAAPPWLSAGERALSYTPGTEGLEWGPCPPFIPTGCEIAVLHGDPAKRNTDIFFKVPPDFAIPHHYHTSPERMVLVSGKLRVGYDNQEAETLTPGTYAYGPAKLPHTAFCEKGEPCVLFIAFEDPVDAFAVVQEMKE